MNQTERAIVRMLQKYVLERMVDPIELMQKIERGDHWKQPGVGRETKVLQPLKEAA